MTDTGYTTRAELIELKPRHDTFVGIDSDGCVLDTMEAKQKQCFHPLIIRQWHLETIEPYVRRAAEFANLYSQWRGTNRFIALVKVFDLLREWPEVQAQNVRIPEMSALRRFTESGVALGNPSLERAVKETGDPELASVLQWSLTVNAEVARTVKAPPVFDGAIESLAAIHACSDAICVSQTPNEALVREWNEHELTQYVRGIAGQELGTKTEHIAMAAGGKYEPNQILMIGDAPGDLRAAQANNAHFYAINPGHETASWQRFHEEAYPRFLNGDYGGDYESRVIADFHACLPATPPWTRG